MRNNKFKLSDMIPNAWFYKLKEIGKTKNQTSTTPSKKKKQPFSLSSTTSTHSSNPNQPNQCNPRKSYYFTRELNQNNTIFSTSQPSNNPKTKTPQTPSKNKTRKRRTTTLKSKNSSSSSPKNVTSSVSAGCSCRTTLESVWIKSDSPHENFSSSPLDSLTESESPDPEFRTDRVLIPTEPSFDEMVSLTTSSCACNKLSNNNNNIDIVIDVDKNSLARKDDKLEGYDYSYDSFSKLELPPIITKQTMKNEHKPFKEDSLKIKIINQEEQQKKNKNKKKKNGTVNSPGVKLRIKSPRIVQFHHGRKSVSSTVTSSGYRRSFSGSLAIVKSSFNPQKDFRESMVEMIVENNIRASKDLEDLLACYLSLNSDEYHDLIIKVFKQIWFDLTETG